MTPADDDGTDPTLHMVNMHSAEFVIEHEQSGIENRGIKMYNINMVDCIGSNDGICAHFDMGAQVSTTNNNKIFHDYVEYNGSCECDVRLVPADGIAYKPKGVGIIKINTGEQNQGALEIKCYYTPELTTTIISPNDVIKLVEKKDFGGTSLDLNPDHT